MSDQREDYGPAGCLGGCRNTLAGSALIMLLAVVAAARLARGGRRG